MNFTLKVLLWMLAGLGVGFLIQKTTDAPALTGITWTQGDAGIVIDSVSGPASRAKLKSGETVTAVIWERGKQGEQRIPTPTIEAFDEFLATCSNGHVLWLERAGAEPRGDRSGDMVGTAESVARGVNPVGRPLGRFHHADRYCLPQRHHDDLALHPPNEIRGRGLR